jgi:predicted amidohydrolase YtcJ
VSTGPAFRAPDTILTRAAIRPDAALGPALEALAIAGGRVVAIGRDDEIASLAGPGTRVIDLRGRAVLPSFTDSHTHFHRAAVVRRLFLDFEALRPASIGDVLDLVARRSSELPPGAWVQGDSLTPAGLVEGRFPDRAELDAVAADRPVLLRGIGKHVVAANSIALRMAGIDRTTDDPPGGRIERHPDGEPSGILHERAKLRLDTSHPETVVPQPAAPERQAALRAGFGDLHRLGITTIHEMVRTTEEAADIGVVHADGGLGVRTRLFYRVHETELELDWLIALGIRRGLGDDWLRVLGVKVSVDGWCIFGNAAVVEPYCDQPDNRGLLRIEAAELERIVRDANGHGLGLAIHAVGPRAVDLALDAFAAAGPARAGAYRLEHGHLDLDAARLDRMRDLDVVWSVQPVLLTAYRHDWEAILEPERIERIMPLADGFARGIPTIHNSDVPSGPQAPLAAIRVAVDRPSICRPGERSAQAVPLDVAWQAWTTLPARVASERGIGSLSPGNAADLIVLDRDPLASTIAVQENPTLVATMIDGRFVYGADGVVG